MTKKNCVIIDVGINRDENNKLSGDVDFNNVLKKYTSYSKVIVVTHGMVINALTGVTKPNCTQIVKYEIKE